MRNNLKIKAAVSNAKAFLKIQNEYGSFDSYIWNLVDGIPIQNEWKDLTEIPSSTQESEEMSSDLKS